MDLHPAFPCQNWQAQRVSHFLKKPIKYINTHKKPEWDKIPLKLEKDYRKQNIYGLKEVKHIHWTEL